MSIIDAPSALLDRILGRSAPSVQPDDPIARMIARTSGRLRPEPTYRRRLRGRVVNQFVAMREGMVRTAEPRREMGRVGRAVLVGSFLVASSVSVVAAASTSSLPGDPLYGIKREIEDLRMDIAPPGVRQSLAEMALDERLAEVEQLATAGRWSLVDEAAQGVDDAEATLRGFGPVAPGELVSLSRHRDILARLLARAPASGAPGLVRVLAASEGFGEPLAGPPGLNGTTPGAAKGDGKRTTGTSQGPGTGHQGQGQPGTPHRSADTPASPPPAPSQAPAPSTTPAPTPKPHSDSDHAAHL